MIATISQLVKNLGLFFFLWLILSNCATICGGSRYYAHVLVLGRPNAEIVYQGQARGNGSASIKVKRNEADKFSLTIHDKGCEPQTFNYTTRTFRGWALVGTLVTWTGNVGGIFVPWGLGIDLATGAFWKPNVAEKGIIKTNYKNFQYIINYSGCAGQREEQSTQSDMLVDVVYLKNGSIIRGTLLEPESVSQVKIQLKDGSIFVYKIDEVLKVTRE